MLREAIYHVCDEPYAFPIGNHQLKIRLQAKKLDICDCYLFHGDRYESNKDKEEKIQLQRVAWDENFDYFEGVIYSVTKRIKYRFNLVGNDKSELW